MIRAQILEKLLEVLHEQQDDLQGKLDDGKLRITEVTEDVSIVDDLGIDSLDVVELIMAIEEEFGVDIPDEVAQSWKNIGDAVTYIEEQFS